ncbi:MAG: hypothetical protein AB1705_16955 [Verrucomicrobiota bacterium]
MNTNRELYKGIEGLLKQKKGLSIPPLDAYLSNLIRRASRFAGQESLSLDEFLGLLRDAFECSGGLDAAVPVEATAGFQKWKVQMERQIEDLQQMAQSGQLQDEHRYFGISAPSGRYWYNFDPCTYIECGAEGSLGGWVEGDETGRDYVPGPVACLGPDSSIVACDPRDLDHPPVPLSEITWEMFLDFAWCGQSYE